MRGNLISTEKKNKGFELADFFCVCVIKVLRCKYIFSSIIIIQIIIRSQPLYLCCVKDHTICDLLKYLSKSLYM